MDAVELLVNGKMDDRIFLVLEIVGRFNGGSFLDFDVTVILLCSVDVCFRWLGTVGVSEAFGC